MSDHKPTIEVNVTKRIAWINEREPLSEYAKELIAFQIKDAVIEALKEKEKI